MGFRDDVADSDCQDGVCGPVECICQGPSFDGYVDGCAAEEECGEGEGAEHDTCVFDHAAVLHA